MASLRRGEPVAYEPLRETLVDVGIPYLDLIHAFETASHETDVGDWFMRHGDYSPAGNDLVASWLATQLRPRDAATPPSGSESGASIRSESEPR